MFVTAERANGALTLHLAGRWSIDSVPQIEQELDALELAGAQTVALNTDDLGEIDLSGAWLLHTRIQALAGNGVKVQWQDGVPAQVRFVEQTTAEAPAAAATVQASGPDLLHPVRAVGRWGIYQAGNFRDALVFFGRFCVTVGSSIFSLKHLRLPALVRQIYETGVQAIPIVALIAFLISVIIAYMGAQELRKFGAEIFVVDLVTVGVLRELAVLLTAIIVAGRSGSAFAAEIGVMKLNDEVDALKAIGTDPTEVLVMPRVLGLIIALPLLTMIADLVGLAGGCLLTYLLLDMPPVQYLARVQEAIAPTTFWVGVMKAPVFAFLIAFVGTLRGTQVRDSSRELGRLTTVAVVQSIFLVIFADAIFAVIFMELDI